MSELLRKEFEVLFGAHARFMGCNYVDPIIQAKFYGFCLGRQSAPEKANEWISVFDQMPKNERVVFIHLKRLGAHGLATGWWHVNGEDSCWVVLDDMLSYYFDDVDYWMPINVSLPLPTPPIEEK